MHMKAEKRLLFAILIGSLYIQTENLPGRTRNLNILRLNSNTYIEFSSNQSGSQNVFRALACNCDNPDFEMTIALKAKPIAALQDLKKLFKNPVTKRLLLKACKKLAADQDINNIDALLRNPAIRVVAMELYVNYILPAEWEENRKEFAEDTLRELLSKDADGKSALDIVAEKQDELACVFVKELLEELSVISESMHSTEKNEKQDLHEELSK